MKLKVALEWFLNPDHLPFIAGVVTGEYQKAGLEVELIAPDDHYDGFEGILKGEVDIHINEPIHLFEHYFDGIKSLGCFFETRGGVMVKKSSIEKLKNNQTIKITTPAANEVTDKIGFEILKRYATQQGFELSRENVEFVQTDFYHLKNLQNGDFDAAWLCFYNFEVIEANHLGFEHLFIDQFASPYANFSALELMSSQATLEHKKEAIDTFVAISSQMARFVQDNPQKAKEIYYSYTQEEPSKLIDSIIEDSVTRFEREIKQDAKRWKNLYDFLHELEILELTQNQYDSIWE